MARDSGEIVMYDEEKWGWMRKYSGVLYIFVFLK